MGAYNAKRIMGTMQMFSTALVGSRVRIELTNGTSAFSFEEKPSMGQRNQMPVIGIPNADWSVKINRDIAEGQSAHEACHHMYSQARTLMYLKGAHKEIRMSFFMAFEDPYIELRGSNDYPGLKRILEHRLVIASEQGWIPDPEYMNPVEIIARYVQIALRVLRLNNPVKKEYESLRSYVLNILGTHYMETLDEYVSEGCSVMCSMDSVNLANDIVDWLTKLQPEQPPENGESQQGEGQQAGNNQDGESSQGEGQQAGNNQDGESSQGEGQQAGDNQDGESSQSEGQQAGDNQDGESSQSEGQQAGDNQDGESSQGEGQQAGNHQDGESSQGEGQQAGNNQDGESSQGEGQQAGNNQDGESSQGEGQQAGNNQDGESSQGEGQQAGNNQDGESSQGEGQQAGNNQNGNNSQGGDSLKGGENNGNDPVSFHDKDKAEVLQQSLQGYDSSDRVNESEKAFERLLETATDASTIPTPSAEGKPINTNVGLTAEERSNVKMAKGMILRPLRAALKSKDWVRNSVGRRGQTLAQGRLYRALIDGKCMETETVSKSENTAVTTLLDMSSSMKDSMDEVRNTGPRRCDVAEQVMLALSSALDQLKVANSAYFFQTDENTGSIIRPYKTFKEKAKTMEKRIGITPSGGTPTGEALWKALVDINQRREPRKVIYVITDGCAQSATQLQAGYELAESLGIEIYTVLIGLDWRYDFAQDKYCRVFNARDLGRAFKDITIKSI